MHPSKERRSGKYREAMVASWSMTSNCKKTTINLAERPGEARGRGCDGTRDEEEEAPGGGERERERGCPRGLSPPRYARVGILTPGSRNM